MGISLLIGHKDFESSGISVVLGNIMHDKPGDFTILPVRMVFGLPHAASKKTGHPWWVCMGPELSEQ